MFVNVILNIAVLLMLLWIENAKTRKIANPGFGFGFGFPKPGKFVSVSVEKLLQLQFSAPKLHGYYFSFCYQIPHRRKVLWNSNVYSMFANWQNRVVAEIYHFFLILKPIFGFKHKPGFRVWLINPGLGFQVWVLQSLLKSQGISALTRKN